ncbi:hypothetical protein PLO_1222 [Pediococcus acidilactici NGRI 0510Q]|nr:hypothetical protein PLO_1222 [Pediococcus acidilactici NGRI 0510Q]
MKNIFYIQITTVDFLNARSIISSVPVFMVIFWRKKNDF